MKRATYLPFEEPLGRPTVHPFGKDFGNGALDGLYFQPGGSSLPAELAGTESTAHPHALAWLGATLAREHGTSIDGGYSAHMAHVAEDLVVLERGEGEGRIVALHVRAPSGWRPERALGASLTDLHQGVPGLLARASGARLTQMMIERGPYVRFVWGLSTSDALDHHPDRVVKPSWVDVDRAYLRVERQITVPLTAADAAIFLIRVYVEPLESLPEGALERLGRVVTSLSPEMRAYKGLPEDPAALTRFFLR